MKRLLFFVSLLFLTGCVSKQAAQKMIEAEIAAHYESVVAPAMESQQKEIDAVQALAEQNGQLIKESTDQVSVHKELLLDTFKQQKKSAEQAIRRLEPESEPAVVPETPAPAEKPVDQPAESSE